MIKAFSLVELMVVVAIVALLSAVAVPVYKDYRIKVELSKALMIAEALKPKIIEYYNRTGNMPEAASIGVQGADTFLVNSSYQPLGGSYVSYTELSRRNQGQSLCGSAAGCSDLVIGWSSSLGIGTANLMWVRFIEQNGVIQMQCGLHENVPGIYRGLYPPNCQGISPGYTTFSVS